MLNDAPKGQHILRWTDNLMEQTPAEKFHIILPGDSAVVQVDFDSDLMS